MFVRFSLHSHQRRMGTMNNYKRNDRRIMKFIYILLLLYFGNNMLNDGSIFDLLIVIIFSLTLLIDLFYKYRNELKR